MLACALVTGAPAFADDARHRYPQDTSGNEPGQIAAPSTARLAAPQRSRSASRTIAPGLTYTRWTQTDARGPVQAHLLTLNLKTPGLRLDYADTHTVRGVATVPDILAIDGAVAGVNGDFYDIGRTGAPLGIGTDLQRGLLHGRADERSATFYLDQRGQPTIEDLEMRLRVRDHPEIDLSSLNSPYVDPDTVGFYSRAWGKGAGYALTQGQRKRVVVVWLKRGKVVRVGRVVPKDKPTGISLLIGRGTAAPALRALKVGKRLRFGAGLQGSPRMAITGSRRLVIDGIVPEADDRVEQPRTAVGVDHDTGRVLLLVVDGRTKASRGLTMFELANLMADLGADDALNLDGGGSSTMVARGGKGRNRVVNTPSDGFLRRVSNALEITYRKPRK